MEGQVQHVTSSKNIQPVLYRGEQGHQYEIYRPADQHDDQESAKYPEEEWAGPFETGMEAVRHSHQIVWPGCKCSGDNVDYEGGNVHEM